MEVWMSSDEILNSNIVRSFKFILKVGDEDSIVNALYG
jgi:hypothetical protein